MRVVERKSLSALSTEFKPHFHDEAMVSFVRTGSGWATLRGKTYRLSAGSLVVVPCGVVHSCNPDDLSDWSYTAIFVAPDESSSPALREVAVVNVDPPPKGLLEGPIGAIVSWVAAWVEPNLGNPAGSTHPGVVSEIRKGAAGAERWLRDHTGASVSLSELADVGGLSPSELARRFRSAYGLPPHAYHLNVRINVAKVFLRDGESPADAAFLTGFCDQSHFHRVFVRLVGMTPGRYQRMICGAALVDP